LATAIKVNQGSFELPVRVYYEDTDAGGVVYHSNYLNFMERARTEWLRHLGFEQTYLKDILNVIFVVHSMQISFKKPAKFNDLLVVTSEISKIGRGSFEFLQKISVNQQILIEAQVKIACVNTLSFKPTAIPEKIRLKMEQI
jgi:tol-pal system-associated acyl-CoA thioesterase